LYQNKYICQFFYFGILIDLKGQTYSVNGRKNFHDIGLYIWRIFPPICVLNATSVNIFLLDLLALLSMENFMFHRVMAKRHGNQYKIQTESGLFPAD
jgi:hypothetical protein